MITVDFKSIRGDWYHGIDYVYRLLRKEIIAKEACRRSKVFVHFPRQWIPVFEWLEIPWDSCSAASCFIPLLPDSDLVLMRQIEEAKYNGQLRLLVEMIASADVIISEVISLLDHRELIAADVECFSPTCNIRLANWHSYGRKAIKEYEKLLLRYEQKHESVIFLPCARSRPYSRSPTHRKILNRLQWAGVDIETHDLIVITSLGPVPKDLWNHPVVLRYDTGVRDIYRILTLFRRMFKAINYNVAWDCLNVHPYSDLIQMLVREGYVNTIQKLQGIRTRRIPAYKV